MPYKSEKIIIANTKHDKRIKLDEDDKEKIRNKYFNNGYSLRALSREYQVDRNVIKYTVFPEFYERMKERSRKFMKSYEVPKEKKADYKRTHRKHKQELYLKGEIKL